ncbi:response regulator [Gammaproteobacteria bacterium]|nr:response regulator [Gammaproteobacteria bacterium]
MGSDKIYVLLVEDNRLVRKMSVLILEQLNCEVDAVSTGMSGIECAQKNNYDLIFMDIGLPDICGLSVINNIRQYSNVPIVALTAHSDKEYILQSFKVGANDFLVKPLNNEVGQAMLQRYAASNLAQKVPLF